MAVYGKALTVPLSMTRGHLSFFQLGGFSPFPERDDGAIFSDSVEKRRKI